MLEGQKKWLHAAAVVGGSLVVVGLLVASFVFGAGGGMKKSKEVLGEKEEVKKEKVSLPSPDQPPGRAGPLILPTKNYALFEKDGGPAFYQYTNRTFEGRRSHPWQAGQYGFVRGPVRTDRGVVFARFHEGIDIKAVKRDARGEPLDTVRAISEGAVAYVNNGARRSNYGKYVVVEHQWDGAPYYSLYAHLSEVHAETGVHVPQGAPLGRIGYTGRGVNRRRAHLHFEINVLINRNFQRWFDKHLGTNLHGVYSGLNMRGLNPAAYFKALREDPDLRITEFIKEQKPYYKITVPRRGPLDILERYPWLLEADEQRADTQAWEFSFTRGGFPLKVEPADAVEQPTVTMDPPVEGINCSYLTYAHLQGITPGCTLAPRGMRYVDLLTMGGPGEGGTQAW